MPIEENFPEGLEPIGKTPLQWWPGRSDAEAFSNEESAGQAAYAARGEEQVPLGVSGTLVAIDWDSCIALHRGVPLLHVYSVHVSSEADV